MDIKTFRRECALYKEQVPEMPNGCMQCHLCDEYVTDCFYRLPSAPTALIDFKCKNGHLILTVNSKGDIPIGLVMVKNKYSTWNMLDKGGNGEAKFIRHIGFGQWEGFNKWI